MAWGTMTLVDDVPAGGPVFFTRVTLVGDASYATGGVAGATAKLQALTKDARAIRAVLSNELNGYKLFFDVANEKLKVMYYDYNAAADGAAIEVPATTDLSAVTFNFWLLCE